MLELGMMISDDIPSQSLANNTLSPRSLSVLGKHIPQKRDPADLGAINARKMRTATASMGLLEQYPLPPSEDISIAHQPPIPTLDKTDPAVMFPNEAKVWEPLLDIVDTNSGSSHPLIPAKTIEELYWENRAKTAPSTHEKHLGQQQGYNITSPIIETPGDPQVTQSFITQIRNKPVSHHGKNTKKSSIWKKISQPFIAAGNTIAHAGKTMMSEYRKPIAATAMALGVATVLGGVVQKISSIYNNPSGANTKHSTTQKESTSVRSHTHTNTSPEFARFLWEQQRAAQKKTEDDTVYPATLSDTPFFKGPAVLNSTFGQSSFTLPQARTTPNPLVQNTHGVLKPITQPTPLPAIQDASHKTETPTLKTPITDVPVGNTISSSPIIAGENIPVVSSVDSGAPKTSSSVTDNTSKTAMFVISYKGKTITITDKNNDGITVKDYRLGLFAAIPGGNISRNTPLMYKMADKMGLDTRFIKPGHENDTLTITNIMPGVTPVTKDCTAHDGGTYTITANTPEALEQAVTQLTHPDTLASSGKIHILPPIPKVKTSGMEVPTMETIPEIPLRAIPLPESELNELGLPPSDMDAGVLPSLDSTDNTLPPLEPIILDTPDVTSNHDSYITEHIRSNGKYQIGSYQLVPGNQQDAQRTIDNMIRSYWTMHDLSTDPAQRKMSFLDFYEEFILFITPQQVGFTETFTIRKPIRRAGKTTYMKEEVTRKSVPKLLEVARLAGLSDLKLAWMFGKKIPPYVIDAANHDGALGTFDMDGWDQTEKLIVQAATKKYNKEPGITELMDFVKDNVSIAKYPGITYREILTKAIQERAQQGVTKGEKNMLPPLVEAKNPERENVIPTQLSSPSTPTPKKQWAWITIRSGKDEISDLQNAIQTIHQDFTVGRDMAKKEGRLFRWLTESDFAKDRYQIIDDRKENISYEAALMKISGVEHEAKK